MKRRASGQDLIDYVETLIRPPREAARANGSSRPVPPITGGPTDEEVIEKCRSAKHAAEFEALFDRGDTSGNGGDDSAADYALLGVLKFWTQDPDQLDRLMRRSALARPKWDSTRVGRTRLRYSIDNALKDVGETYDWGQQNGRPLLSSSGDSLRETSDDDNNKTAPEDLDDIVWFSKAGPPKEREYLIESVAVKKYTMVVYGAGGVAKSFAVLAAGIAIAGGSEEWLGLKVLDHGYVLYLDFELDAEEQHRRVRDLCAGMGVPIPEKVAYLSALSMPTEKAFANATAFVEKYKPKAVTIDSMGLALAGNMDQATDVIAFHKKYTDPLRVMGTTPLVVDHEGKRQPGENHKSKGPSGSAFKSWVARSVLQFILEEYDEDNSSVDVRVRQHKTNFKPTKPFGVRFTFGEHRVGIESIELPDTELVDESYVPVKDRIVAALESGEATIKELVNLTGAETGTLRNKLSALMGEGRVKGDTYRGRGKL